MNAPQQSRITWQDNIFTESELQSIHHIAAQIKQGLNTNIDQNPDMSASRRTSETTWLDLNQQTAWLYKKVSDLALEINSETYGFELTGIQPFQYTVYRSTVQGQYPWHSDLSLVSDQDNIRKLSLSIILSKNTEYTGGRFLFSPTGTTVEISQQYNRLIVFPSWTPHCVMPVQSGTRISLVSWLHGKAFK